MASKKPLVLDSSANLQQMQSGDFLDISNGGTGATTAAAALVALGAYPASNPNSFITSAGAPVQSVAGRTGAVTLAAADISGLATVATTGAYANLTGTPTKLSQFTNDSNFITASGAPVQSVAGRTGAVTLTVADVANAVSTASLGVANGVATLGADGKLTTAQIPSSLLGAMQYQGVWNASTNSPALTSGSGTKGQYYKVSVAGTTALDGNAQWEVGDMAVFDGTTWDRIDGGTTEVTSVAGRVGAVTLSQADISGLTTTSSPTFAAVTAVTFNGTLNGNATNVSGTVAIANGGTGATTAAAALSALGAYPASNPNNYIAASGAPVQSVAGRTGAVVLAQADITGLTSTSSPTFAAVTAGTFNGTATAANATTTSLTNTSGASIVPVTPVYVDSAGGVRPAKADADSTSDTFGLTLGTIGAGAAGTIVEEGDVTATLAQWQAVMGSATGLTPGATYFLSSATAGMLTATPPTTGYIQRVGKALSTTKLSIRVGQRIQL